MRKLYSLLFYIILPFIFLRITWRGLKVRGYLHRWNERLGYYRTPPLSNSLWLHAVSVGEAEAMFPLVKKLQERYPQQAIVVTSTTPTGSARVQAVLGASVNHVYLPYDTPGAVQRFFRQFKPKLAVIMETELWPNLFAACKAGSIPLFIINARLSPKSVQRYQKVSVLVRSTLADVDLIAAQSSFDKERFLSIGAAEGQVKVVGNIKFDIPPMDALIEAGLAIKHQLFAGRYVFIVASTHKDEEKIFLDLYQHIKAIVPKLLLIFVPRHPERFEVVNQLCLNYGLSVLMRTAHQAGNAAQFESKAISEDVYIADTLGELKMLYATADLAFVGGSMVPVGGHNVLEPAAVGVPVLFGPYMENSKAIADGLLKAQAAVQCPDAESLKAAIENIYNHAEYRQSLVTNASKFVKQNQGATQQILAILQDVFE